MTYLEIGISELWRTRNELDISMLICLYSCIHASSVSVTGKGCDMEPVYVFYAIKWESIYSNPNRASKVSKKGRERQN